MKCVKSKHLLLELRHGWVPLFAVFCSNFVILAAQKTFPVLYVVLREQYQSSATETSWLSGLLTLLTKCLGKLNENFMTATIKQSLLMYCISASNVENNNFFYFYRFSKLILNLTKKCIIF